ncbi:MAG: phosphomannomutase [Hahellaceae bacterium]|nr:phosphomannomutase [Hahellaceae bacterium]MCP5168312.1 phosphomannomutase [Hahellaceae bacterium]
MAELSCFKAYDIRGKVPSELNPELAEKIGRAYVQIVGAKKVVVGHDIRLSSPELTEALIRGLRAAGADVFDIGLCGTEMIYFATFFYKMDGGIVVTASHNPQDYNGMKLVQKDSRPVGADSGLNDIKALIESGAPLLQAEQDGSYQTKDVMDDYIQHLLSYVDVSQLKPLKIVVNAGHGGAGLVIDAIEKHLPFEFIKVHHNPDGNFPAGVPNPLLEENRAATADVVRAHNADLGLAWDGDYDRCFLFDEKANFIEGYYIVGLLAQNFLNKNPGNKVIHDPRLTWNTIDIANEAGGVAVESKTGHAFIKQRMRDEDAIYGGEMSAHHYFKRFAYCDSGMITWLVVAELVCQAGLPLSALVESRQAKFPASGEINRHINQPKTVLAKVREAYEGLAQNISTVDGLSMDFGDWRFNLRSSNTEPVVRLNVESRADEALMRQKTAALLEQMAAFDPA